MLSGAFKGAYTNAVSQKSQGIGNITQGVKDIGTVALGVAGFTGMLGDGVIAKGAKHALAGRVGGVGGNIMLATMEEKKASATTQIINNANMSPKGMDMESGDYKKQVQTVFETLTNSSKNDIINKKGQIESSLGTIDPNSELGKKVLGGENDND